jgi:cytochrome c peroxidase
MNLPRIFGRVASREDKESIVRFLGTLTGELDAKP